MFEALSPLRPLLALAAFAATPYLVLLAPGTAPREADPPRTGYELEGISGRIAAPCTSERACDYSWDAGGVTITAPSP